MEAEKWDDMDGNFVAWPTNPPYKFALDCNTWGYCAFPNFNDAARSSISRYEVNVTSTETGEQIDGYCLTKIRMYYGLKVRAKSASCIGWQVIELRQRLFLVN